MKLLIIGAGYVGLVTATCFAEVGYHVVCLDIDTTKIAMLEKAQMPIYEVGLRDMVVRNSKAGRLTFTTDYAQAMKEAQAAFICVDTPSDDLGACDLSRVKKVAQSIATHMQKPLIVVVKSTAPIGTCESVKAMIRDQLANLNKQIAFSIASNPEFLKEGCAIADFMKPDRVIIGVDDEKVGEFLSQLYSPFTLNRDRLLVVDLRSSEMIKYASNAMLATRISFMNELAGLCEHLGADINRVRRGIGADSRIGTAFLYAGAGFGGSCFPKDIRALRALAQTHAYPTLVLDAIDLVNRRQKHVLPQKVLHYFSESMQPTLAVWGLAFKPETDDMREASSLVFIEQLWRRGYSLRLFDPLAQENAKKELKALAIGPERITWCTSEYDAAEGSDGIALLTEWKQFRQVDFAILKKSMNGHVVFDGRNQYQTQALAQWGFDYLPIGRAHHLDEKNRVARREHVTQIPSELEFDLT